MKRYRQRYPAMALLFVLMLAAACTRDDDFASPDGNGTPTAASSLTITVTDEAYAPVDGPDNAEGNAPATRVADSHYGAEFIQGDQIGLYAVEVQADGTRTLLHDNLCLTCDGSGWTLPDGVKLIHRPPADGKILYFAYYPWLGKHYDKEVDIWAKDDENNPTEEARYFFRSLIRFYMPVYDQSRHVMYTQSDLIVAHGEVTKRSDSEDYDLSFTMEHQMALMIVHLPTTECIYTETIDGKFLEKSYYLYTGAYFSGDRWWMETPYLARCLYNPAMPSRTLTCVYYNYELEKREYTINTKNDISLRGKYVMYTVDFAQQLRMVRPLKEGDLYMADGGILTAEKLEEYPWRVPYEEFLGVVFWVGEKATEKRPKHWAQSDWIESGDRLLMRDYPECMHGLVVAKKDAYDYERSWSSDATTVIYEWLKEYPQFSREEQVVRDSILLSDYWYGYQGTRALGLFKEKTETKSAAYDAIDFYTDRNRAPLNSSGWFFPGYNEMQALCTGKVVVTGHDMRDKLNELCNKIGGAPFKKAKYWSSTEYSSSESYCVDFGVDEGAINSQPKKTEEHYIRAVLAF